jgi:hypothetical protein
MKSVVIGNECERRGRNRVSESLVTGYAVGVTVVRDWYYKWPVPRE